MAKKSYALVTTKKEADLKIWNGQIFWFPGKEAKVAFIERKTKEFEEAGDAEHVAISVTFSKACSILHKTDEDDLNYNEDFSLTATRKEGLGPKVQKKRGRKPKVKDEETTTQTSEKKEKKGKKKGKAETAETETAVIEENSIEPQIPEMETESSVIDPLSNVA